MSRAIRNQIFNLAEGIGSRGGASWSPPFKSDALFWLDGTIIDISGSKYLEDKSGNERHFLITGYDFDTDWSKGLPYKTNATISAPAGDATLIAGDVNNFLYAANQTPIQIRPTYCFQNIDYANKLFTRHLARTTDLLGIEVREDRISDIVLYGNAKTETDLVECNTAFSVPVITDAVWVAKNGNNTSGDGTMAKPYLTIQKAVNDGLYDTIYVRTGTYTEGTYLNISKPIHLKGLSRATIWSTDSPEQVRITHTSDSEVTTFEHIHFDASAFANRNVTDTTDQANHTVIFEKCHFGRYRWEPYQINNQTVDVRIKNCLLISDRALDSTSGYTLLTPNYTTSIVSVFENNYIRDNGYMGVTGNVPVVHYNKIVTFGAARRYLRSFYSTGIDVDFRYNKYICENETGVTYKLGLHAEGAASVLIAYNHFIINNIYSHEAFWIDGVEDGNTQGCHIHNNYIYNLCSTSHCLSVGTEETTVGDNTIHDIVIEKNRIIGVRDVYPTNESSTHTIYVGFQQDAIVRYNYVSGGGISILIKGSTGTQYTTGYVFANIVTDYARNAFFSKGVAGVKVIGNTFYNESDYLDATDGHCVYLGTNYGGDFPDDIIFKNNINIYKGAENTVELIRDHNAETEGLDSDYNVLYNVNTQRYGYKRDVLPEFSFYLSFAQWQTYGQDLNSIDSDVTFVSGKMYPVVPYSQGENLGSEFISGLAVGTDWGNENKCPTISTKQQANNWQIGAYVQ